MNNLDLQTAIENVSQALLNLENAAMFILMSKQEKKAAGAWRKAHEHAQDLFNILDEEAVKQ